MSPDLSVRLVVFLLILSSQVSGMIYLNNCTFALHFYQQYLNLLYASNDSHTVHLQAIYSYPSNHSFIPGHIYNYQTQSVALIPLFIHCKSPSLFAQIDYLPFTQCSSTISTVLRKRNYEPTRTYLNLQAILSLRDVPLLYAGEYNLLLSNCSFRWNSTIYQLTSNDFFSFHIQYERAIADASCQSCNQRTSICHEQQCVCRPGASPIQLFEQKQFCLDTTTNCSLDPHRCLNSRSTSIRSSSSSLLSRSKLIILIFSLILGSILLLLSLTWVIYFFRRKTSTHTFHKHQDPPSDHSIYIIHRHERTPSMVSTSDSTKCSDFPSTDSSFIHDYVSRFDDDYPRVLAEQHTIGDVVLIYA